MLEIEGSKIFSNMYILKCYRNLCLTHCPDTVATQRDFALSMPVYNAFW